MQHVLQTALASGFSATEGFHSSKPNPVDPSFDGLAYVQPQSFVPKATDRLTLPGKHHNVEVSWLCVGAWPWGDKATWHWNPKELTPVRAAWAYLYKNGINYIDTAQAYGSGESERICGDLIKNLPRDKVVLQTKYYVVPDNKENLLHPQTAPIKFLKDSLHRTGLSSIDIYMVHGNIHPQSHATLARALADCVDQGLCKVIAVANYSTEAMLDMQSELAKFGVPLALNQCEYHVFRRLPETSGLLKACRINNIQFQSYASLAESRLTGKWSVGNEPPKTYRFSSYPMEELEPRIAVLKRIAEARGVPVAAVSLNYNISKGVLPVVGIRNEVQARENIQALGWRLSEAEIRDMDAVSIEGKHTKLWQQG